jgi:hypothetical protein
MTPENIRQMKAANKERFNELVAWLLLILLILMFI